MELVNILCFLRSWHVKDRIITKLKRIKALSAIDM